jgi:microsomal dipeptidase-like Zn-dependent dipeptidase
VARLGQSPENCRNPWCEITRVPLSFTVAEYVDWIDYCVGLVGIDHVSVSAQDDWHRSFKDTRRIAPYLPSFAAEYRNRDWNEDKVYRRGGIGARLLDRENLSVELRKRNYLQEAICKILGGNLMRVLKVVLP